MNKPELTEFTSLIKKIPEGKVMRLLTKKDNFDVVLLHGRYHNKKEFVTLTIETSFLMRFDEDKDDEEPVTIHYKIFDKIDNNIGASIYNYINKLKFHKYHGEFFEDPDDMAIKQYEVERKLWPQFFEDVCAVCLEPTITKTNCGHRLCYQCWDKVIEKSKRKCPTCRKFINLENETYEDDDYDDE